MHDHSRHDAHHTRSLQLARASQLTLPSPPALPPPHPNPLQQHGKPLAPRLRALARYLPGSAAPAATNIVSGSSQPVATLWLDVAGA